MIVYHGSYCLVDRPNVSFSRDDLDFGKGFYVTEIQEQAINWAAKFKKRGKSAYINVYNLDIDSINETFRVKKFLNYDLEWLDFILDCRAGNENYLKYEGSKEV